MMTDQTQIDFLYRYIKPQWNFIITFMYPHIFNWIRKIARHLRVQNKFLNSVWLITWPLKRNSFFQFALKNIHMQVYTKRIEHNNEGRNWKKEHNRCKWKKLRDYMKGATQMHTIVPVQGENDTRGKSKKNETNAHICT